MQHTISLYNDNNQLDITEGNESDGDPAVYLSIGKTDDEEQVMALTTTEFEEVIHQMQAFWNNYLAKKEAK